MELKILSTLILILSLITLLLLISTIYLYIKKSSVNVDVVYIPKKLEFRNVTGSEKLPDFSLDSTTTMIKFETFNYDKLLVHSLDILEYSTDVSTFVVDSQNALKIVKLSKNFLINKLSEDTYFLVVPSKIRLPGLLAGKSVYTIFLKTGENAEPIFRDILNLRSNGFSSFAIKFKRNNKIFYSLCLGAFPDIDSAKEYLNNLNVKELKIYTYRPYAGRITH
ncbi:hypothetical protein BG95_02165 [Thermosipho sp. 1063]|uniref:hypothetical protein n=1 Tax=unclassified Thermosipho (in: thermotogales) TaxID=2676525 RepID=UPI00094938ED|nr:MULTISPECIES: hypothetical protein [unclassified Thermosipho (in: thermotogales)]ANQ53322.1 hypothetical protein Y592_02175 [Thermosipho sp. 1070]APT71772.1 hypothetical protein BG95_02165 [Thermosipho sp. 1063]